MFDYRDLERALVGVQRAYHCPPSVIETEYEPMIAVTDGQLAVDAFAREHVKIVSGEMAPVGALLNLLGSAAVFIVRGESSPPPT